MNTDKVNTAIALTNILIVTSIARTLERLLFLKRIRMARLYMKVKIALLEKAHITVLACMGKCPIMLLHVVVHRGLNTRRVLTMRACKLALGILGVGKNHFNI
jgi:hypothetical protein